MRSRGPVVLGWFEDGPGDAEVCTDDDRSITVVDGFQPRRQGEGKANLATTISTALASPSPGGALRRISVPFAAARFDDDRQEISLVREPFGTRPLFWAQRGAVTGFASDPEFLVAAGLTSREIDRDVVTAFLRFEEAAGERTALRDVSRVRGGQRLTIRHDAGIDRSRWFAPEAVPIDVLELDDAAAAFRTRLLKTIVDLGGGRRPAVALSSGRDSTAIAVALAEAGIKATCISLSFDPDLGCNEVDVAGDLAGALGHDFRTARVPSVPTADAIAALPRLQGFPIGFPAYPLILSLAQAASEEGADILFDGTGGEPLFSAAPVVVLDLVKRRLLRDAWLAATTFDRKWTYDYRQIAKAAIRGLAPRQVLEWRERSRSGPPWLSPTPPQEISGPSDARSALVDACLSMGSVAERELAERFYRAHGVEVACPLVAPPLVDLALHLDSRLRAPVPEPKPVPARAFLRGISPRLSKVRQTPYFERLASCSREMYPDWFDSRSALARQGLVGIESRDVLAGVEWKIYSLAFVPIEAWLRQEDTGEPRPS